MADNSILKDLLNGTIDMVVPHARKEPLNPMAYVKDVNEWFVPSAQMALDEAEGTAEYPAWAYGLASAPFIGKLAKPIAKVAGKAGKKVAEKTLKEELDAVVKDRAKAQREYDKANKALTFRTIYDDGNALYNNYNEAYKNVMEKDKAFRENFAPYLADENEFQKYVEETLNDKKFARSVGVPRNKMDYWGVSDAFAKNWKDEPEYLAQRFEKNPYGAGGLEAESPIVREYAQNHVANVQKPSPEWTLTKEEPKKTYGVTSWDGKTTTFDTMEDAESFVDKLAKRGLTGFKIKEY